MKVSDEQLGEFLKFGVDHFVECALIFGEGWATMAMDIALDLLEARIKLEGNRNV